MNIVKNEFSKILKFCFTIFKAFILSFLILIFLWAKNNGVIHTLMELVCVCIAFTSFIIVWTRYEQHSTSSRIVSFGFLITGILDSLHTFYYPVLSLYPTGYYDLAARYWIIARLTEAIVLLCVSFNFKKLKLKRNTYLAASIIFCFCIFYLLHYQPGVFPILHTVNGFTNIKILLDYFTIFLLIFALLNFKNNQPKNNTYDSQYLVMSIILFITSEICFTLYHNFYSFFFVFGHILKIASFYYIFRGIIEMEINKPYIELEKSKKHLESILDAIPIALHTFNDDSKFDFANKSFEDLFCCSKDELTGLSSQDILKDIPIINGEDQESLLTKMKSSSENSIHFIRNYISLMGDPIKVSVNMSTIENGILVLIEDIKKIQKIDNLNLQTKTILNSIPTPVLIVDNKGVITHSNQAFVELLGLDNENIIGTSIQQINQTLAFTNEIVIEQLNQGIYIHEYYETTFTIHQTLKEVSITISSVRNIDDENIGLIYVLKDITNEKANQQKLINQEKLALLGQMGATIVHETRNFLTTIMGCSQLILNYTNDLKIKHYASQIQGDIGEVNRIMSDFLTISKPREVIKSEIAINDLINSMKSTLETSSLIKGVNINFILEDIERYIECDEAMIKQVILNLSKNAVEAMSENEEPILSIVTKLDEEKNEVVIIIHDNGKGISEEHLSKLGHAFFTTKTTGTGLGLNVCYQIIKEHNGTIVVESELGKGTSFIIRLPCIEDEEEDEELFLLNC